MCRGKRWRMRVDDFAIARGATAPITSKQTAGRVWEPKFVAEIMAGRDPHVAPTAQPATEHLTVADFLDRYYKDYVEAEGLRDPITIKGQLAAVKEVLGNQEVATLEKVSEMLRIQNRYVDWDQHQIAIPGAHAKDAENRRIPFDPKGRLAPILKRRKKLGQAAYVFGSDSGEFQESFKTAWESLLMLANGHDSKRAIHGARVDRSKLRQIDLHWHDLRHEGASRLLADGVDIRTIQLMLGHADIKQTQRYLNITDEELRKAMTGVWERRRQLRLTGGSSRPEPVEGKAVGE
jgi:integrase